MKLATNVFLPKDGKGKWPVILTRTPYSKDNRQFQMMGGRYLGEGYAYVLQDCRGKFRSEGEYRPFENDYNDGFDTVEWVAKQDFCDGNVGMSGASAMGITANLAASADPPHLKAAYVVVAPHSMFYESSFIGGVFKEADVGNWMRGQGAGAQVDELKSRPVMDEKWKLMDLPEHLKNVRIPMYNVGGWFDIFCQGNLNNFEFLQTQGRDGAKGHQKLLMGPFGHGNLAGDLQFVGDGGLVGAFKEEIRWFDYWLKGVKNGIMDEPPVKYYMMASARKGSASSKNGFKTCDCWPPKGHEIHFYLGDNFSLGETASKSKNSADAYNFDPKNPVPTVGGANLTLPLGPLDQRQIKDHSDYLRYQTAPLDHDLTIAGKINLELYASTDGPDTDFMAKLVDVYPDGYEALIQDGPLRARYRDGRRPEDVKMMKPGEPAKMVIDLWSTANTFEKGHRIAVHVTSSNSPRFEVNPNTGEEPGKSTLPARVAKNTIYHDADHPSAIILPVLGGESPIHDGLAGQ